MKSPKVRKIGNCVGVILLKGFELHEGDILSYPTEGTILMIEAKEVMRDRERKEIEKAFADFSKGSVVFETEMKDTFSTYGWGE